MPAIAAKGGLAGLFFGFVLGYATGKYVPSFITGLAMAASFEGSALLYDTRILPVLMNRFGTKLHALELGFGLPCYALITGIPLLVSNAVFAFGLNDPLRRLALATGLIGFTLIQILYYFTVIHADIGRKAVREQHLRALSAQFELKALKAQINPHFLFNTLNGITELIHSDPALAEATVQRLADMLRYVLDKSERMTVRLKEELDFIDAYLSVEKTRFGKSLHVRKNVEPGTLDTAVPGLILQPLIENALRHGRERDGSVHLGLSATYDGEKIFIRISDNGPGLSATNDGGAHRHIGMKNVESRLLKTYGAGCGMSIRGNEPHGTMVEIRVPRTKGPRTERK